MDTLKTASGATNKTPASTKKKILVISAIVLGAILVLLLILGLVAYFVFQHMYTTAFYNNDIGFADRTEPYQPDDPDADLLKYIPNQLIAQTDKTVYKQGDAIDKASFTVKLRYFNGEKMVEEISDNWYFTDAKQATQNVGSSKVTLRHHITYGRGWTVADIEIPLTIVEKDSEITTDSPFKAESDFTPYSGGYNLDILSYYSEEIRASINDGYQNTPIYRKEQINPDVFNILVIGASDIESTNELDVAETIMVVSINKETFKVTSTSLLRDTFVPIEGYGWNKLRASYRIGGPGMLVNTINEVYGLDIQHYIELRLEKFELLLNNLGGFSMNVTAEDIEKLELEGLTPGECTISGDNIHKWLVYNGNSIADISRTQRHSMVIKQLISEYANGEKSVYELINICMENQYITTNLNYSVFFNKFMPVLFNLSDVKYSHNSVPAELGNPYNYVVYKDCVVAINIPTANLKKMVSGVIG